jgi:hypothetical protein
MNRNLRRFALVAALGFLAVSQSKPQLRIDPVNFQDDPVMRVDEEFRLAKLHNDTGTLGRILSENFYETNQNGNSRNKAQTIELWTSFPIRSLTTDSAELRITGQTAVVTGSQTELNSTGTDKMLYMRVYANGPEGWRLAACMQYRDPKEN